MRPLLALSIPLAFTLACAGGAVEPLGTQLCAQAAGGDCASPATSFPSETPTLHVLHRTETLPKLHQTYTVQWIAVQTGGAIPDGQVLTEVPIPVEDEGSLAASTNWTVESEIEPPTGTWPPGSYKVTITLDGAPVTEQAFTIQ